MSEAHKLGLIHRDIKPGNIFAAERGGVYDVAKLLDFGLAKPIVASGDISLTQQGAITGSPLFMSPEQATGEATADARSDIYAVGCVAYYMLTGHPPFEDTNAVKVLLAHAQRQPAPLSKLRSGIPADLESIVLKCLEKKPADRYQNVSALSLALAQSSLHGKWSRDDAEQWWQTNGGVDRDGVIEATPATVRANGDGTLRRGKWRYASRRFKQHGWYSRVVRRHPNRHPRPCPWRAGRLVRGIPLRINSTARSQPRRSQRLRLFYNSSVTLGRTTSVARPTASSKQIVR